MCTRPPTTTAPPAPTHSTEGCCSGYSAQTSSYCNNFEDADQCESAGVCSWIDGGDDDDCTFTPPPTTTLPPALTMTTTELKGCCAGNSPMTWSFCLTLNDNHYGCTAADECTWIEGDDDGFNQPTT